MSTSIFLLLSIIGAFVLAMKRAPLWLWALAAALAAYLGTVAPLSADPAALSFLPLLAGIVAIVTAALSLAPVRRAVLTRPAFNMIRSVLPRVSETEQQALDAGTIGFDAELFSGRPDWAKLRAIPPIQLTDEEQAFLDGPTEELCAMLDDWEIRHTENEIPERVWDFAKKHGFLGMLISKEHGGLGFSAQAQSLILGKIASRSPDAVTIVMVPNSLGPGELLEKYGTTDQQEKYLKRLAQGLEVPCFSLTGPTSGSDAATMRDVGYVERGTHDGRETLGIRLSWQKRYITLGPKATLMGLAFYLFDPDNLLGKGAEPGITVALIPTDHPGVNIGRRHLPSGAAFPNGPNWGTDVFVPVDWIIGGGERAGDGWRMLMECLSAGRAISLPSSGAAGTKSMLRMTSAYGRIRKQFGLPVARMEGLEEPMVRLAENAYVVEAARAVTAAMVSRGEKPSVISALMKYQTTERLRTAVNDAMDLHGGRGICDGPSNYLQSAYQMVPVGITVEGANILTRSLITFTQGALRAHPHLYDEIKAVQNADRSAGFNAFDRAFMNHLGFAVSNVFGALFHNLTAGMFAKVPDNATETSRFYRQLGREAQNFALVADMTVGLLGGGLKVKQKLTGRLADALSELYLLSCTLKRFEDDGRKPEDLHILTLAMENGLARFDTAIRGAIDNFPITGPRVAMRWLVYPFGTHHRPAADRLGHKVVRQLLEPGDFRDRLTRYIYISKDVDDATGILEVTFEKAVAAEEAERKLDRAIRAGEVRRYHGNDWFQEAVDKGVLTIAEGEQLRELEKLTSRVIAVDHFDPGEVKPTWGGFGHNSARAAE
jgi:acyl-CoA dehydrogenase